MILVVALIFMFTFTAIAFRFLLWQSSDISVNIVSETEEGNNEVKISMLNTAGSTLLFYESAEVTGKIEYLSENGWVEYCDVSYTLNNVGAISQQYGGLFAELEPGENWTVSVPADKIEAMTDGTYRIKMTYITENNYNRYLDEAFKSKDELKQEKDDEDVSFAEDESKDVVSGMVPTAGKNERPTESIEEEFLASAMSEVFIKTFEYTAPEDFVDVISIDDSEIEKSRNAVYPVIDNLY